MSRAFLLVFQWPTESQPKVSGRPNAHEDQEADPDDDPRLAPNDLIHDREA
jgi:hypothetical protein